MLCWARDEICHAKPFSTQISAIHGFRSGLWVLGQMVPFLLPDSVISKRERLEEFLKWELISKMGDVEGENMCEPMSCPFSN